VKFPGKIPRGSVQLSMFLCNRTGSSEFQNIHKRPIPSPKTFYTPCVRKTVAITVGECLKIRRFFRRYLPNESCFQTPLARGRRTPPRRLRAQPNRTRHPSQECRPTRCMSELGSLGHSGLGACERGHLLRCRSGLCEKRGPLQPETRFQPKSGPNVIRALTGQGRDSDPFKQRKNSSM